MHQVSRGTGRKLLLVHGLGGSLRSWSPILDSLSVSRAVIAIDLPGHGATPAEHDSGTFDGLVGSLQRYIVENELAGIDVVGSSMGARMVLELARRGVVGNVTRDLFAPDQALASVALVGATVKSVDIGVEFV